MVERTLLFETPHGSRLYGLARPGSDHDCLRVYSKLEQQARGHWAYQSVNGADDVTELDLPTFLTYAGRGVPQCLEAMWSPCPTTDLIGALRFGFRPDTALTVARYQRAIRHFWVLGTGVSESGNVVGPEDHKRMLLAYRLTLNLVDLVSFGRFNPVLSVDQRGDLAALMVAAVHPLDVVAARFPDLP